MKKIAAIGFFGLSSLLTPSMANASEDFFKPILKRERPLRIFIACWPIQSFHETTTILFKNLFSPDDATTAIMARLGWSTVYQNSTVILDILDF